MLDNSGDAVDPHIWLDPVRMSGIVSDVQRALTRRDPGGRAVYRQNAEALRAELADLVKREHVTVVFTEKLVSPRIAPVLAREAGVTTEVLDPLESLSTSARRRGATYVTVMDDNLKKLRSALDCSDGGGSDTATGVAISAQG